MRFKELIIILLLAMFFTAKYVYTDEVYFHKNGHPNSEDLISLGAKFEVCLKLFWLLVDTIKPEGTPIFYIVAESGDILKKAISDHSVLKEPGESVRDYIKRLNMWKQETKLDEVSLGIIENGNYIPYLTISGKDLEIDGKEISFGEFNEALLQFRLKLIQEDKILED